MRPSILDIWKLTAGASCTDPGRYQRVIRAENRLLQQQLGEHHEGRPRARLRQIEGRGQPITLLGTKEAEVMRESYHQNELLELTGGRARDEVGFFGVVLLLPEPSDL